MKILILNRDYPRFLANLYGCTNGLHAAPYSVQLAARNASLFGMADFYSHGFARCGHDAREIHVNNIWLQSAWARENGLNIGPAPPAAPGKPVGRSLAPVLGVARRTMSGVARRFLPRQIRAEEVRILAAQIEQLKPDVILNQEMSYVRTACLSKIVRRETKIVGQIASALPMSEHYGRYDLVVSSLPNIVEYFRTRDVRAEFCRLAFDPRVLELVRPPGERDIDVSFVGSLSADHQGRIRLIETLAGRLPLKVWGSGVDELPASSPIRSCFQGEAWGASMYGILMRSRVTINQHIDLAEGFSNNMRLYEATGCGALMMVDRGRNLGELFEVGKEVIAYSSAEECAEETERILLDDACRTRIASAGQRRTLSEHTYANRTMELSGRLLRL